MVSPAVSRVPTGERQKLLKGIEPSNHTRTVSRKEISFPLRKIYTHRESPHTANDPYNTIRKPPKHPTPTKTMFVVVTQVTISL